MNILINTSIQKLKPSATLAINQKVKALRAKGKQIVHFGFGQSPFPIHQSIVNALKENATCNDYLPTTGLPELKKQLCKFLKKHQDLDVEENNIYIGPGSKELLFQTKYILDSTFLIPQGSWVSYLPQVQIKNATYVILKTYFKDDFKLTSTVLENYCKQHPNNQKTLILNSPNNPTGSAYTEKELQSLAKICRQYNIIVLSDEIYSQINFDGDFTPSISKYYPQATIVYGGLSKVFSAGGYRLGFMVLPKQFHFLEVYYKSLFSETFSAVASPIQYAAVEAYKMKPKLQLYIKQCTAILNGIASYIFSRLTNMNIKCTKPKGAFYMMIDFEHYKKKLEKWNIKTSTTLADYLLEKEGIALLSSTDFYFDESYLIFRLAFVDFDGEKVYKAYKKNNQIDEDFIKKYASNIYLGMNKLQRFVEEL